MKRYWDGELLAFGSALTATIVIHFYATIMAFFLCLGVAFYFWKRIFFKERFVSLVTTAVLSVCIAVVPMVAGYLTGIPLQGSLYWGMNVIQESVESPDSGENIQNVIEKEQVQE